MTMTISHFADDKEQRELTQRVKVSLGKHLGMIYRSWRYVMPTHASITKTCTTVQKSYTSRAEFTCLPNCSGGWGVPEPARTRAPLHVVGKSGLKTAYSSLVPGSVPGQRWGHLHFELFSHNLAALAFSVMFFLDGGQRVALQKGVHQP